MSDQIALRDVVSSERDQYRRLRLEALQAVPTAYSSGYETEASAKARKYGDGLSGSAENYVLGAWEGERLVGIVGFVRELEPRRNHIGFVWGLYVQPGSRGRGVGRRLMQTLTDRARALQGVRHLLVTVVSDNETAAGFYRGVGFRPWGTQPAALQVDDVYYDEIHLMLEL
jgi:ribosomal protein S18 acetylase RimI-like enzyme